MFYYLLEARRFIFYSVSTRFCLPARIFHFIYIDFRIVTLFGTKQWSLLRHHFIGL